MSETLPLRQRALLSLSQPGAPRVLSASVAWKYFQEQGVNMALPTVKRAFPHWVQTGDLVAVRHGVFLNVRATPRPTLDETAAYLRKGAIISLQTVLGRSGVYNNPTPWITCVVPQRVATDRGAVAELKVGDTQFRFSALPGSLVPQVGDDWYDDAFTAFARTPTAPPETALVDWL
jgi:hypothetical protein